MQAAESPASAAKIGLALSGGGFRAALFHVGVLARLAEIGILRRVEVISSVSGGSIIGALYYIHVKNLLERKPDSQITDADYVEIVPARRIVFTYRMTLNGAPLSASATSITMELVEGGTLLTHTEHGIYLDGEQGAKSREDGTQQLLELLGSALDKIG